MMDIDRLRKKHSALTYRSYSAVQEDGLLRIEYDFLLEPNISFRPVLSFPVTEKTEIQTVEGLIFHLGLVEMISYWKVTCPSVIRIEAGYLDQDQIDWWRNILLQGLGEFFYVNQIDYSKENFLRFEIKSDKRFAPIPANGRGKLVLVGGGKDSVVSMELLKSFQDEDNQLLILNPIESAIKVSHQAAMGKPLIIKREIDPTLLELNARGYLNGHTPFSSYLSFLGVLVAVVHHKSDVIVSNERSSNEGSVEYLGSVINHQFSKTYEYESLFREYNSKYLTEDVNYFSLLRPLYEIQIGKLFSQYPDYFSHFRSCNVGQKTNSWCGNCPKCLFVFAILYPFIEYQEMMQIFGEDLYQKEELWEYARQLTDPSLQKPLECVGTIEESLCAFWLAKEKYQDKPLPALLNKIEQEILSFQENLPRRTENLLTGWDEQNFVPDQLHKVIKGQLAG